MTCTNAWSVDSTVWQHWCCMYPGLQQLRLNQIEIRQASRCIHHSSASRCLEPMSSCRLPDRDGSIGAVTEITDKSANFEEPWQWAVPSLMQESVQTHDLHNFQASLLW